jgi:hypothetical protein
MNDKYTTFKAKVGIDEIASYLGYKLDRKAGVGRYIEMCLRDGAGRKTDSIIISHPNDKSSQTYFHRNGSSGGDVISLIKENLNTFGVVGETEYDMIDAVIDKFTGTDYTFKREYDLAKSTSSKIFDDSRYVIEPAAKHFDSVMSYFRQRSIDEETVRVFLPYLVRITDTKAEFKYRNLAFPYSQPGSDTIEGCELRGYSGFKMKAEGTNSSTAAWIADFSDGNAESVRNVYFFESGYDAMAFYQVNKSRIDLPTSVFVSTGGSFSNMQIRKVTDYYAHARYWECFDNDKAGILYGIRMEALLNRVTLNIVSTGEGAIIEHRGIKTVKITNDELSLNRVAGEFHLTRHVSVWKAPKGYKDWNDVTMNKPANTLVQKTKFQRDENLRENRIKRPL